MTYNMSGKNPHRAAVIDHLESGVCMWFGHCTNRATHTQYHPIIGDVPICDRCQEKYDRS